jgi:hypothetical protein
MIIDTVTFLSIILIGVVLIAFSIVIWWISTHWGCSDRGKL